MSRIELSRPTPKRGLVVGGFPEFELVALVDPELIVIAAACDPGRGQAPPRRADELAGSGEGKVPGETSPWTGAMLYRQTRM